MFNWILEQFESHMMVRRPSKKQLTEMKKKRAEFERIKERARERKKRIQPWYIIRKKDTSWGKKRRIAEHIKKGEWRFPNVSIKAPSEKARLEEWYKYNKRNLREKRIADLHLKRKDKILKKRYARSRAWLTGRYVKRRQKMLARRAAVRASRKLGLKPEEIISQKEIRGIPAPKSTYFEDFLNLGKEYDFFSTAIFLACVIYFVYFTITLEWGPMKKRYQWFLSILLAYINWWSHDNKFFHSITWYDPVIYWHNTGWPAILSVIWFYLFWLYLLTQGRTSK